MKRSGMVEVMAVAAVTMVVVLALIGPAGLRAIGANSQAGPRIVQPTTTVDGCIFTLKTEAADGAGESPKVKVEVKNPTNKPVATGVWISIASTAKADPTARMMPRPKTLWSSQCVVSLQPGESKTVPVAPGVQLPAEELVTISMSQTNQMPVSTQVPTRKAKPELN